MKMLKRVTALFLCFLMLNSGPLNAFATEDGSGNDAGCTGCTQTEGHLETCSKYEAPVEDIAETAGPQVGDKIWIKHDSYVYKSQSAETGHKLLLNYEVEIVSIITNENGNAVWYEFEPNGALALFYKDYKYVQVENTSVEEPEATEPADENTCNCGENAPENIADHADSCPRKQYIKTLFEGKTAEEIYGEWENYDEATQNDLLNMLQKWDNAKYEELEKLVNDTPDGEKEAAVGDIGLKLQGVPEDVTLNAQAVTPKSYHEALFDVVGSKKVVFAIDINLINESGEWQPAEGEPVTVSLDAASLGLAEGDRIGILHEHDGSLNDLGICTVTDGQLTFTTSGFSVFYGYTVDFEYDGTWHSIGGGSDIYLYELFAQLGITRSTSAVSSVSFSDSSLISVTKLVVDGYTGAKDWHIQSLAPFDTEEILTVTFSDGSELQINVYDAAYGTLSNNLILNNGDSINATTVNGNVTITVNGTVTVNGQITINSGASLTINGSGTLKRGSSYLGRMFSVTGGTLTINGDIKIDGGASWSSNQVPNSTRCKLTVNNYGATGSKDGKTTYVTSAAIYVGGGDATNGYKVGTVNLIGVTMQNLYTSSGQAPAIHVVGDSGTTINATHSTVNMTNVVVQSCATMSGQAITLFNDCLANLNGCKYLNNYSGGTYAGTLKAGGPTYFSQLNMTSCEASGNYSSGWGGVLLWAANNTCGSKSSKATIDGCSFLNNKARYLGGALSNEAIMEVKNTTIKNNIAMAGGGIATFPFTLTETHEGGGNACGLTLGSENTIQENTAFATGDFTPFLYQDNNPNGTTTRNEVSVNTYNSDSTIADDTVISSPITYTGGGGGVWCYMNKPGWTCSLNIGSGNNLISNDANNVGGGVYVHNVASAGTTLSISGAKISENTAPNGGGVAVKDATVSIDSGEIASNVATVNGGGIYVDNGTCTVSGTGSVSDNTSANGGGIYIDSGSLTVSGGVISGNDATGSFTGSTAKDAASGVGGGIYVKTGSFTMSGTSVGLHSNTASVAANDAFASGSGTTLVLPDVETMDLAGWTGTGKPEGWFADYMGVDVNYPASVIKDAEGHNTTNRGRYNYYDEDKVEVLYDSVLKTNTTTYYCLTIGTPHPGYGNLVITKTLTAPAKETQTFIFEVTGTTRKPETAYSLTVTLVIEKGKTTARVLVANIPDGTYTVTEKEAWSWRYDQTSREFHPKDGAVISETTFTVAIENPEWVADFTNKCNDPFWLSGDSYCENWWGGNNGTTVTKREEHY